MSKKNRKAWWAKNKSVKQAWFQGQKDKSHDGAITSNNPETLGYPKEIDYSKTEMAVTAPGGGDSRDWEQKWFEGAAADTKKEMGPAGAEFKLKQEQQRIPMDEKIANAKLSAKFKGVKGSPKESAWTIFANGEPVLSATLDEIWGNELDEKTANETRTAEYIKTVFAKLRSEGFSKVSYLLTGKGATVKTATAPVKKEEKKTEKKAWYKEEMDIENALGQEVEATDTELGVTGDMAEGKLQEIESLETQIIEKVAPDAKAVEVFKCLQEAEVALEDAEHEVTEIQAKLRSKTLTAAKKIAVLKIAEAAIADAVAAFEAADEVMEGAKDLIPEGALEKEEGGIEEEGHGVEEAGSGAEEIADHAIEKAKEFLAEGGEVVEEAPMAATEEIPVESPAAEVNVVSSEDVKKFISGRKARREALAGFETKEEKKYNIEVPGEPKDGKGEIERAHPEGGHQVSNLTAGGKPSSELDKFETQTEAQDIDLKVAEKMPKGTYSGSATGVKVVTAEANVAYADADTKKYWVDYFGLMGPEGKAFGEALVGDHTKDKGPDIGKAAAAVIKKQAEIERGKLIRANELAELAASKGMVEPTSAAKNELVNQIMDFNEAAFAAYKSAVDKNPSKRVTAATDLGIKTASVSAKALKVGQISEVEGGSSANETDEFSSALSGMGWS